MTGPGSEAGQDDRAMDAHHVGGGHGHEHPAGHDPTDEHGEGEPLGPIDWPAWGAAALGLLCGLLIAAAFWIVTLA